MALLVNVFDEDNGTVFAANVPFSAIVDDEDEIKELQYELVSNGFVMIGGGASPLFRVMLSERGREQLEEARTDMFE